MSELIKAHWLKTFGAAFDGPGTVVCVGCGETVYGSKGEDVYIQCLPCLTVEIQGRLKYLREEIIAERISMDEICELQSLADCIDPGDTLLLEWAGVPENAALNALRSVEVLLVDILDNHPGVFPAKGLTDNLSPSEKTWRKKIQEHRNTVRGAIADAEEVEV